MKMHVNYFILILLAEAACFTVPAKAELLDSISSLISVAVGQRPNNENGTASQFKHKASNDKSNLDIVDSTTQEIIEHSGFRQETHEVVSDDGYITQLINIINPLVDRRDLKRPPVMMFHGGNIDSSVWVWVDANEHFPEKYPRRPEEAGPIKSSNRSAAFMLANNGFDVWLIGTRGANKQNLKHLKYKARLLEDFLDELLTGKSSPESLARELIDTFKYFDYSMDELVDYEFPRQIEAVLKITGSKKVSIVGVSYSTPIVFEILTSNKSIASKIHSYVALLPLLNSIGSNKLIEALSRIVLKVPVSIGTLALYLITSKPIRKILRNLDRYTVYKFLLTLSFGPSAQYQTDLEDSVLGHLDLMVGFKQTKQFMQGMVKNQLQRFDHGSTGNVIHYGSLTPPVYDLSNFKLKRWMIINAANDVIGTPNSTAEYVRLIPVKPYKRIEIAGYNHADALAAFDNDIKVNLPMLEFFEKFKATTASRGRELELGEDDSSLPEETR